MKDGVVSGGGRTMTYGALIGDKLFNAQTVAANLNPGQSPAKPVAQYKLVGTSPPRIDIPDKVTGKYTYVQNVRVPGMLHARVVRPRGQGAYGVGTPKVAVGRRGLDQEHPERPGRPRRTTSSRVVSPTGVRRDPGGRAAEGEVGADAEAADEREPWRQMRQQDTAGRTAS